MSTKTSKPATSDKPNRSTRKKFGSEVSSHNVLESRRRPKIVSSAQDKIRTVGKKAASAATENKKAAKKTEATKGTTSSSAAAASVQKRQQKKEETPATANKNKKTNKKAVTPSADKPSGGVKKQHKTKVVAAKVTAAKVTATKAGSRSTRAVKVAPKK